MSCFRSLSILAALVAYCSAGTALAQKLGMAPEDPVSPWKVLGALILCLGVAVAGVWVLRTRIAGAPALSKLLRQERRLNLVEALRISRDVDLAIIECDGQEILVAASARSGVQILPMALAAGENSSGEGEK